MDYKIVQQVARKQKPMSGVLRKSMVFFAILFLLAGIAVSRGMMLPAFLFAALYFVYDIFSQRDYEYVFEDKKLTISVILGKRYRKTAHVLDLENMETVAPNWHEAVAKYRKNGGSVKLPKYDYTSYDDDIPFYTMIITERKKKIKLLLDLNDEALDMLKRFYPQKVYTQ